MAEHKFEYFLSLIEKDNLPLFLYENDFGFLAHISKEGKKNVITSIDEPLASQENIIESLKKIIEYCFEIKKIDKIDRYRCHEHVKNNFNSKTMIKKYMKIIENL